VRVNVRAVLRRVHAFVELRDASYPYLVEVLPIEQMNRQLLEHEIMITASVAYGKRARGQYYSPDHRVFFVGYFYLG
jgi:hypothetical protein